MKTAKESDKQLRDAVLRQLEWDPQVTSNDINVATADGVVTLTGVVHHYAEKYAAEKAAQAVYGVQALADDIEVKPGAERTDPEIARDAVHAMKINVTVPDALIVSTSSSHTHEKNEGNVRFCEFGQKTLFRRFDLPQPINLDKVTADLNKGVLDLTAPKAKQEAAPKPKAVAA